MGLFGNQFSQLVEWDEFRDDMIFWKWPGEEIKKGSRLIIRPGQDAIFLYNGRIEGIFADEGEYDIESQIVPFLTTLKSFRFGFHTAMRAEVLFVNTREFQIKWGTKNAILIPTEGLPGGLPVRSNGTLTFKVTDYVALIDQVAGTKQSYLVEDVKLRITAVLDQLLMKWISQEGKDLFHLQANANAIAGGLQQDLNMELLKIGCRVTGIQIMSFNYPEEIQKTINQAASTKMLGNLGDFSRAAFAQNLAKDGASRSPASDMAEFAMGMKLAGQVLSEENDSGSKRDNSSQKEDETPLFCPYCGAKLADGDFCPRCGKKVKN